MNYPSYKVLGLSSLILLLSACGSDSDVAPIDVPPTPDDTDQTDDNDNDTDDTGGNDYEVTGEWQLVWSDEFDGDSIDTSKWSHEVNCWGGGNNELQCYTDREENSFVEDGYLHLVAREETFSGPGVTDDDPSYNPDDESVTRQYTSARLRTKDKGDWQYGRVEINAKMPQGQGLWPAIWMLPTEGVYGGWPLSGEIDIFEAVNPNASGENEIHGTLHYGRPWPNNAYSGQEYVPTDPIWEEFHTYAIEWEEGEIRWFVDDVHYATQRSDGWYTFAWNGQDEGFYLGEGAAPFDEVFHLILNVAVGGDWPGEPDGSASFPQEMVVDYVRIYECDAGNADGRGCPTFSEDATLVEGTGGEMSEFPLYADGAATLNFEVFDTEVENTLVPGQWEETEGNLVVEAGYETDDQTVWDIQFHGLSNVFLSSGDMSDVEYVEDGFSLQVSQEVSGFTFDLRVLDASADAQVAVKIDSGYPNVSSQVIDLPSNDSWHTVHLRFSDFSANDGNAVNFGEVENLFVLELQQGDAHLQLNNITLSCFGESCGVNPKLDGTVPDDIGSVDVFSNGQVGDDWNDPGVDTYTQDGQDISSSIVDDSERGDVLEIGFGSAGFGTMYIQNENPRDLSAYSAGSLVFDLKVVDAGSNTEGFLVKADCIHPCSSHELPVDMPEVGEWTTVSITISELTSGSSFILNRVDVPFSFWPVPGSQADVTFRLDNIRWEVSE